MTIQAEDMGSVDALVLAGGTNRIPLYPGYRPGCKALLAFDEKTSLRFVLEALEKLPGLRRRVVVGPPELAHHLPGDGSWELLPTGGSLRESLYAPLQLLRRSPAVLCTTADLPLLETAAIDDFLRKCARAAPGELFLSMVPEGAFRGSFAKAEKGFNRFRDVAVCHGNLFLLHPRAILDSRLGVSLDRIYRARKSTVRAGLVLGPKVGLAYLFGVHLLRLLTLEQMLSLVSRRLALRVVPVLVERPGVALDVDEPGDYELVRELLEDGPRGGR